MQQSISCRTWLEKNRATGWSSCAALDGSTAGLWTGGQKVAVLLKQDGAQQDEPAGAEWVNGAVMQ